MKLEEFWMSKRLMADIGLFFVTIGWSVTFILSKNSLATLAPYNFLAIRFLLAFIIATLFFWKRMLKINKTTLKYGFLMGLLLFVTYAFQTVGLVYTTPSKSAFINGMSVVLVPIFISITMKILPDKKVVFSVILSFAGLGLLTLNQGFSDINIGDIYTFFCAVLFAVYIILIGKINVNIESISMAVFQLGIVGILSLITSFFIENPGLPEGRASWINILILSVICTAGAYIIINLARKYTTATHTALIYVAEPVFAAFFAYFLYGEVLSKKGILGAILILIGMLLAEINFKKIWKKNRNILKIPKF